MRQIAPELAARSLEMNAERQDDGDRQWNASILIALPRPNKNLASVDVHVLDTDRKTLRYPQPAPVHQPATSRMALLGVSPAA